MHMSKRQPMFPSYQQSSNGFMVTYVLKYMVYGYTLLVLLTDQQAKHIGTFCII